MHTIVTFGGGTNSVAVLLGMLHKKEPPPHAILFADTGGEKPHTYAYAEMFSRYLQSRGYPPITILRRETKNLGSENLYDSCFRLGVLPSVAYGWKTCSQKYKIEPQDRWANRDATCRAEWAAGRKITKVVGFDFGEIKRARFGETDKYILRYPLIDWRIDRARCVELIKLHSLPLPGKSACFYCPHSKKKEILGLGEAYPDLLRAALALERNAAPKNKKTKGLGRSFAWADLVAGEQAACAVPEDPFDEEPCGCYDG